MPLASVWLIRLALIQLLSGSILGAAYLSLKAGGPFDWVASHRSVHVEQMLVGWMVQLVIGVAYYILPRAEGSSLRGPLIWIVLLLINAGVVLAALGTAPGFPAMLTLIGRIAEALAAGLFLMIAWNRQRGYRAGARRVLV